MSKYKVNFKADIKLEEVGDIEPHMMTDILTLRLESDGMTQEDAMQSAQIARPEVEDSLKGVLDIDFSLKPVTMDMIEKVEKFDVKAT
jgi:predicted XRE-type DNA-binding protein